MFAPEKLKECRDSSGLSGEDMVREMANKGMEITRQTLSSWEMGHTVPNANQIDFIARFFNKPLDFFFENNKVKY